MGDLITYETFRARRFPVTTEPTAEEIAARPSPVNPAAYDAAVKEAQAAGDEILYKLVRVFLILAEHSDSQTATVTMDVYKTLLEKGLPANTVTKLGVNEFGVERVGVTLGDLQTLVAEMERRQQA